MKPYGFDGKIAVVVGTITDDKRIYEIPKMTVSWCFGKGNVLLIVVKFRRVAPKFFLWDVWMFSVMMTLQLYISRFVLCT
jgi:hypothetical protein